jgi:hypothetical protein
VTYQLDALHAREILDSRSRPTLAVTAVMAGGAAGEAGGLAAIEAQAPDLGFGLGPQTQRC